MRRSRHHTQKKENHGRIIDAVSIRERPAAAKDRAVPGHWEGDLLCGSRNSQIATLVERHTRYVMLVKLEGKDSETFISALIENAHNLPQELYKSLTWDRGKEMADHKCFTVATDIKVYFCLDLSDLRHHLADFYSPIGRPSIDPELMTRMQIVGYCYAFAPSGDCAKRLI